ncbi:MAG TPA: signal peptidase I [Actinomycetota bacterium]|jgi:signal peptidase I|nr:signal peptidase I [Actinomycetota bacterium]
MGEARPSGDRPSAKKEGPAPVFPQLARPGSERPDAAGPAKPPAAGREELAPEGRRPGRHRQPERSKPSGPLAFFRELPGLILVAFVLALLIKTFLVQAFYIPSQSMEPTLLVGDRVLVNKFIYAFREPARGEVIVFENPRLDEPDRNPVSAFWHWIIEGLGVSTDPEKDFIKRVIGLPGETIEVNRGKVFVDGERIQEPYLNEDRDLSDFGPFKVPQGNLFVMGDNRANSQDSRSTLGPVPRDKVVGEAFILIWPPSHFEWLSDD